MKRLLDWLSPSSVVDPFMGSGSTLVAAVHRGIRAVGIEQKPEHFDAACQRVEEAVRQPRDMFVKRPAPPTQEALL
jgi:DNA modification methylase